MPESVWSRFILHGSLLLPGEIPLDDKRLSGMDVMIEIRKHPDDGLPIGALKNLASSCGRLLVDPYSNDHRELIDCLMLGSTLVCIDHRSEIMELELAHAASSNIVVKVELEPQMLQRPNTHLERLNELSQRIGELILVKTREPGILEEWWLQLPSSLRGSWKWILAAAEGEKLALPLAKHIHSWAISGDLLLGAS